MKIFIILLVSIGAYANEAEVTAEIRGCLLPSEDQAVGPRQKDEYADEVRKINDYLREKKLGELKELLELCQSLIPKNTDFPKFSGSDDINFSVSLTYLKFIWLTKGVGKTESEIKQQANERIKGIDGSMALKDRLAAAVAIATELAAQNQALVEKKLSDKMNSAKLPFDADYIADNSIVNLMWLNKEKSESQLYLFPQPYERQGEVIDIIARIKKWAQEFPRVIFWYDGEKTTAEALARTRHKLDEDLGADAVKVTLRDLASVDEIAKHPVIVHHKSVYFRTDFFRVALTKELLQQSKLGTFVIYADLSITPFTKDELLDKTTVFNLNTYGFMMPVNTKVKLIENNFHIMGNHVPNLLKAFDAAVIGLNARRAETPNIIVRGHSNYDQIVWSSYTVFFLLFYYLENKISEGNFHRINQSMSTEEITDILWGSLATSTSILPSDRRIVDETLRLQSVAEPLVDRTVGTYVPVKIDDKFPASHYTQTSR